MANKVFIIQTMDIEPPTDLTSSLSTGPKTMEESLIGIKTHWKRVKGNCSAALYFFSPETLLDPGHIAFGRLLLKEGGAYLAGHLHPTKLSASEYQGEKFNAEWGALSENEKHEALTLLTSRFKEAFGIPMRYFRAGALSFCDRSYSLLEKFAITGSFNCIPGRANNKFSANWTDAFAYAHLAHPINRLIPGDRTLKIVEIPVSVDRSGYVGPEGSKSPYDMRPDWCNIPGWQARYPITADNICANIVRDRPANPHFLVLTHNETDFSDHGHPRTRAMIASMEAVKTSLQKHGLEMSTLSLEEYLEAVRAATHATSKATLAKAPFDAEQVEEYAVAQPYATITVLPSGNTIGADIRGIDFSNLSNEQIEEIRRALAIHKVIRFRGGKPISDDEQVAFTRRLGPPCMHAVQAKGAEGHHRDHDEIMRISNKDGALGTDELLFHSDMYVEKIPPSASILRAVKISSESGSTHFCDVGRIYRDLQPDLRQKLLGRMIQFDVVFYPDGSLRPNQAKPDTDDIRQWPHVRHPVVRTDRSSGENTLFLGHKANRGAWIVGLPLGESNDILHFLWNMVEEEKYHWVQEWQPLDMIVWDNRKVLHYRGKTGEAERLLHRTSVTGDEPVYIC